MQRHWTLFVCVAVAVTVVAFAATPPAKADKTVKILPVPDWVEPVPIPAANPKRLDQIGGGIYYLLNDLQQRKTAAGADYFTHVAYRVTERAGLENAARIDNNFDPGNEDFAVNFIHIVRDGAVLNALSPGDVTVLRREANLERGLFDGRLTADIQLRDVRVGDIVEFGVTWVQRTPLWPDEYFRHIPTRFPIPLGLQSFRLIWPEDAKPLNISQTGAPVTPLITQDSVRKIYRWQIEDPEQIIPEDKLPNGYDPFGGIYLSTMNDWSQVSRWAFALYDKPNALPADFAARIDAIAKANSDPVDRITEAVRLIEDTIRYVSISIDNGSFIPRPAAAIVADGFGDCKDKSTLLAAVLKRLGVEAYPALTVLQNGGNLARVQPAITAFNHMIVLVRYGGADHWIDPTLSHQGGRFPAIAYPSYGYALPIMEQGSALLPVKYPPPAEATTVGRQDYAWNPATQAIDVSFTIAYRGLDADLFRGIYSNIGRQNYDRSKLDYIQKIFRDITETQPLSVRDDREKNEIETREHYAVGYRALLDQQQEHKFPVHPALLRGFFAELPATRRQPYALNENLDRRDIITVTVPTLGRFRIPDATVNGNGFVFTRRGASTADSLELDYRLKFTNDRVSPDDFLKFRADIRRMDTDIFAWIDINRDFYHRYYRYFPRAAAAAGAAVALAGGLFAVWYARRRRGSDL